MQCFLAKIQIMCVMCNSVKICFLSFRKQLYQKDCILSQFWHSCLPIGRREQTGYILLHCDWLAGTNKYSYWSARTHKHSYWSAGTHKHSY